MANVPADRPPAGETWGQTPSPGPSFPMSSGTPPPAIAKGSLLILRQFDVADEIDLAKAATLHLGERNPLSRARATALLLSNPPLNVHFGQRTVQLDGRSVEAEVHARIFDFGAVSIRFRVPMAANATWAEVSALTRVAQTEESTTRVAREVVKELVAKLGPAMKGPNQTSLFEDYVIVNVEQFVGLSHPQSLPLDAIARLLLGEPETAALSSAEVDEATRRRSSYLGEDLCVTGWNVALVVEPSGDPDTIDVLELANAQLLELRYYDDLLDRELAKLYDEVAVRRGRSLRILRNYGPVLRRAMSLMLEIAEFIERVENALKIIGDVYLARLYASAVETLRIPSWERSVTRKQELVHQVYDVLKSEVDARRGQILEVIVIVLIAWEILLVLGVGH